MFELLEWCLWCLPLSHLCCRAEDTELVIIKTQFSDRAFPALELSSLYSNYRFSQTKKNLNAGLGGS